MNQYNGMSCQGFERCSTRVGFAMLKDFSEGSVSVDLWPLHIHKLVGFDKFPCLFKTYSFSQDVVVKWKTVGYLKGNYYLENKAILY